MGSINTKIFVYVYICFCFYHQGRDLLQMIESTGIEVMASGQFTAQTRIQVLLDDIKDVYLELEDVAEVRRVRLEQCRNLRHFEIEAEQVSEIIQEK